MQVLPPMGLAPLRGKVSWQNIKEIQLAGLHFVLQTPQPFALVSRMMHHPWRIIACEPGLWVGRVIAQSPSRDDIEEAWTAIEACSGEFEEEIDDVSTLQPGDICSVPTAMFGCRHFAVYDDAYPVDSSQTERGFIEYQGGTKSCGRMLQLLGLFVKTASGANASVVFTSLDAFVHRLDADYPDGWTMRRVRYPQGLAANDRVLRARQVVGTAGYHFVLSNCETFATWVAVGEGRSSQAALKLEHLLNFGEHACACAGGLGTAFAAIKGTGLGLMIRLWYAAQFGQLLTPGLFLPCFCAAGGTAVAAGGVAAFLSRLHTKIADGTLFSQTELHTKQDDDDPTGVPMG